MLFISRVAFVCQLDNKETKLQVLDTEHVFRLKHIIGSQVEFRILAVIGNAFSTIMKILPALTLTFLLGCNSLSGHIEQQVDSKVETAKQDMDAEIGKSKKNFITLYQAAENNQKDNLMVQTLQEFQATIIRTDSYLDSLKNEMDKLDEMDVNNVQLVKSTFLYKGAGDTIINKLKSSIEAALAVAKSEKQKAAIKAASDTLGIVPNPNTWKEQAFGQTNPLGASMVLYGLRTELYKIGTEALSDQ